MDLNSILLTAVEMGASDIHMTVNLTPMFRVNGSIISLDRIGILSPESLEDYVQQLIFLDEQREMLQKNKHVDLSYSIPGAGRFRVNIYTQRNSKAIAVRIVNTNIPEINELGLPDAVEKITDLNNGLVLVTGPTGSGKSTTIASLINKINSEKKCHIITLEDPIEYVHNHKKSIVNQREIGTDALDFASALKAALRQDPDVILVGEMRDLETISVALTAAETGQLVFATLHTVSAAQTMERIVDVFPAHQQMQIRTQLANSLQAIISQQLLPLINEERRIAAVELLLATPAVKNLMREGKTHQILNVMQTSGKKGMQTMDSALRKLYQRGLIDREEIIKRGQNSYNYV
jgi:twitching motility protein PilT